MTITDNHLEVAYRKLKSLVYYDKTDLRLRQRLAEFECDSNFKEKLGEVKKVLNSDDSVQERLFKRWLNQISFRIVPKGIEKNTFNKNENADNSGKFISNVTSAKVFEVEKVNYFFDGPIQIQLLAVLWIMFEGRFLDSQLGEECYGSRLEDGLGNSDDNSAGLFRKYHEHYARWWDSGIRKANQLLTEEQTSVCILNLDIQEYYYHIRLDVQAIAKAINETKSEEIDQSVAETSPSNLLRCLEAICLTFRQAIDPCLQLTHEGVSSLDSGIPIGLCSSPLLANWYLRDFDKAVKTRLRPAYYGRYVDDILLVVPASEEPSKENPVATFMDRALVQSGLLHDLKDNRYEIATPGGLFLQPNKCILQYFDADHSIAGLDKFRDKLEKSGSDFMLMPVDEADSTLEDVAYDLLYEGSVNKFRSVKGIVENRYELAKYLARQTILHLLTDDPPDTEISSGLRKFFKGKNAIEFHDLWERVFTFFLVAGDTKAANAFIKHVRTEIKRVQFVKQQSITERLVSNLEEHLSLCIAISGALGNPVLQLSEEQQTATEAFRRANLIRHHFVRLPLLNYTTYSGPLNSRSVIDSVKIDSLKMQWSPRYVNFDECLLLAYSCYGKRGVLQVLQFARDIYRTINRQEVENIDWNSTSVEGKDSDA